jgi:hypothetical protein
MDRHEAIALGLSTLAHLRQELLHLLGREDENFRSYALSQLAVIEWALQHIGKGSN